MESLHFNYQRPYNLHIKAYLLTVSCAYRKVSNKPDTRDTGTTVQIYLYTPSCKHTHNTKLSQVSVVFIPITNVVQYLYIRQR